MNGNPLIRACADCEVEHGIMNREDASKSHGQCRRHFIELIRQTGASNEEIEQILASMSDESFCPDLGPVPGPP